MKTPFKATKKSETLISKVEYESPVVFEEESKKSSRTTPRNFITKSNQARQFFSDYEYISDPIRPVQYDKGLGFKISKSSGLFDPKVNSPPISPSHSSAFDLSPKSTGRRFIHEKFSSPSSTRSKSVVSSSSNSSSTRSK